MISSRAHHVSHSPRSEVQRAQYDTALGTRARDSRRAGGRGHGRNLRVRAISSLCRRELATQSATRSLA
ncbi:unnamed protein product [Danaus chrysippus]|uniref:(African queen) hypothetical protein n=1 Tax=Danaus chrysippus TaxID=151541 RepID=A0A8J2R8C3_9NEOP|nr:unnamed protein product [Danaus chrysippus]